VRRTPSKVAIAPKRAVMLAEGCTSHWHGNKNERAAMGGSAEGEGGDGLRGIVAKVTFAVGQ
jgi:hypothetical protein